MSIGNLFRSAALFIQTHFPNGLMPSCYVYIVLKTNNDM